MFKMFLCLMLLVMGDIVGCTKPDYIYNERAGGWMKLHLIAATWQDAFMKCHYEGAVLASPLDENLAEGLHMIAAESIINSRIHLGTYSLFNDKNFVSVEGVSLDNMFIKWSSSNGIGDNGNCLAMLCLGDTESMYAMTAVSCSETYPYICYKKKNDHEEINECGTFDKRYHLNRKTGSCYKLHTETKPWSRAYEICTDEGGYLVIINDETEAEVIRGMFPNRTESRFTATHSRELMHVGVRSWETYYDTWLTIHGEQMEDVYNEWSAENLNNDQRQNRRCGFISKDGSLNKNDCDYSAIFVCEKDPKTIRYDNISSSAAQHRYIPAESAERDELTI